MRFRTLNATFGRLEKRTLSFSPGLNLIEAPNESGKSTLTAFLRAMLYGLPTRDRGALADKNRYNPWSGSPMQGALDISAEEFGDISLRRETARADSPMGRFSATYSGTGDEVPGLSGTDCGERLLGVPREIYERSAFIRQSSLTVDPDAELERRIASLITTGEESVSYTEASAALKKQLNLRRANSRVGRIPTLDRETEALEAELEELRALDDERGTAERELDAIGSEETVLRDGIRTHEIADCQEQFAARERAKREADDAARAARVFRGMLADSHVPPREVLEEDRSRLRTVEDLGRRQREADRKRSDAELALSQFDARPAPPAIRPTAILFIIMVLACAAVVPAAILIPLSLPRAALYGSVVGVVLFAALLALDTMRTREKRRLHRQEREALADSLREAEAVCGALKATSDQTLSLIYDSVPAGDSVGAATYIHENLARYDMLAQMEAEAARLRQGCEALPRLELKNVPAHPVKRPEKSREELCRELDLLSARRAEAQSRVDSAKGRALAIGSADELEAELAQKRTLRDQAQEEYDAIALAMETLDRANAELQQRFSPELGKRAAEYFGALTGGKYDSVTLDRSFCALASETGGGAAHDAALLSRGAADQLYLAVRLAICDMVLPADKAAPLVLDDALTSFDDERCAAALELLCSIAQKRQVLLLTCQHREAEYLAGREGVSITSL